MHEFCHNFGGQFKNLSLFLPNLMAKKCAKQLKRESHIVLKLWDYPQLSKLNKLELGSYCDSECQPKLPVFFSNFLNFLLSILMKFSYHLTYLRLHQNSLESLLKLSLGNVAIHDNISSLAKVVPFIDLLNTRKSLHKVQLFWKLRNILLVFLKQYILLEQFDVLNRWNLWRKLDILTDMIDGIWVRNLLFSLRFLLVNENFVV